MPSRSLAQSARSVWRHAPRVAGVLHAPVGGAELGGEVGLHERQVAPHVEDLVEDLDVDRAGLVARLARGARPHLLGGDALEQRVGLDGDLGVDAERRRDDRRAGGGHDLAGLQHDLAGVERLARGVGGAHRGAAAAHRAGVRVEQLLPGELLDRRGAEALELGLHEVRHRPHRALGPITVLQVHVDRRREDVPQHRGRQEDQEDRRSSRCGRST